MSNTEALPLPNALAFAGRGHSILPLYGIVNGKCGCGDSQCKSGGKHPHSKLAPNGLKNAITDRDTIKTWFAEQPTINYGVVTDDLPTIDIDPRNGGDKAWLELVRKNYDVHTWTATTGGGGRHIMFGSTSKPVPNGKLARGVDIKGVGGYIVGVGSLHLSGKRYCWFPQCHPREVELKAPPQWIVDKIEEAERPKHCAALRTPEYYNELLAPAMNGERHHRAASLIGHVFSRKPERAVLLALVISHIRLAWPDLTDFGDKEILDIARDIANKEDRKRLREAA
jgi:hypothetical protein